MSFYVLVPFLGVFRCFWVYLGVFVHRWVPTGTFLESGSVGEVYMLPQVATGLAKVRWQRLLSLAVAFAMKFAINNGGCA